MIGKSYSTSDNACMIKFSGGGPYNGQQGLFDSDGSGLGDYAICTHDEDNVQYDYRRVGVYGGLGFLVFMFLLMVSCTMHSNSHDAERIQARAVLEAAEAETTLAEAEVTKAQTADRIEEIQAIERLINNGTDPVSARCAIKGWGNDELLCGLKN